jgi:hypothetical protein
MPRSLALPALPRIITIEGADLGLSLMPTVRLRIAAGSGGTNNKGLRFLIDATSLTTNWDATAGEQVSAASFVNGTVIEVEVDRTAGSVKIFRNGAQLGATITGLDPADLRFAYLGPGTTNNKLTANFGGSAFVHPLGSGVTIYG